MVHTTEIRVRFGELDPYRHVNHAVYVMWMEAARTVALEDIDLGLGDLQDMGYQIVVTDIAVRFRRPAVAGDTVTVETEVAEIRRASSRWVQRIMRGDELLVSGEIRAGICDETGRPTRPPAGLMEKMSRLDAEYGSGSVSGSAGQ